MILARATLAAMFMALSLPVYAHDGMAVRDAYMRVSGPVARSGAGFLVIENHRAVDVRLTGIASDVAARVELHTHVESEDGVMRMNKIDGGIVIPAGGEHALQRGGDHVMFLGLSRVLEHGDVVNVTLSFENAGDLEIELPVDLERTPDAEPQDAAHQPNHSH